VTRNSGSAAEIVDQGFGGIDHAEHGLVCSFREIELKLRSNYRP
jgi:hypothetical protein